MAPLSRYSGRGAGGEGTERQETPLSQVLLPRGKFTVRTGESSMTADNFVSTLEALMSRTPFKPFTIELHGGSRLEFDHRLAAAVWPEGKAIFASPGGVPIYFDNESVVQIIDAPARDAPANMK